jgi:hypothetical protein
MPEKTRMRRLVLLLLASTTLFALPSQRDTLNAQYLKARSSYGTAQKSGKKDELLASFTAIQDIGNAVIAANQTAIAATTPGSYSYPADIKSAKARQSYDLKMANFNRTLRDSNATLSAFVVPADTDAAAIRAVDSYINTLTKAIETHHATCQNIR